MIKPGFTRLNLSVLMPEEKVDHILNSVIALAEGAGALVHHYQCDPRRAIFSVRKDAVAAE
jgi:hypothetical protein